MLARIFSGLFLREHATMTNLRKPLLAILAVGVAVGLSGCCVTSLTSRKVCQSPATDCQQPVYEPIPQGIAPMDSIDPPAPEPLPAPAPVPPAPSSANLGLGTRTTMMMRQFGDQMRDTFVR